MKSRPARFALAAATIAALSLGCGAWAAATPLAGHESAASMALETAGECPDQRRVAPKPAPKPKPETVPARERPPSSLPCCRGADCTCSGPPALAAVPDESPAPPARVAARSSAA